MNPTLVEASRKARVRAGKPRAVSGPAQVGADEPVPAGSPFESNEMAESGLSLQWEGLFGLGSVNPMLGEANWLTQVGAYEPGARKWGGS